MPLDMPADAPIETATPEAPAAKASIGHRIEGPVLGGATSESAMQLPTRSKLREVGFRRRHIALAAGVGGALAFSGLSGFGTHVRTTTPLLAQLEALGVAAGLGINEISISGLKHTLDAEVFTALGPTTMTLAGFDVAAARARIEALSWVETATLARVLPDKLRIDIRERQASAVWHQGERKFLVDAQGRILGALGNFVPPNLPHIAGDGAPQAAAELFGAIARHPDLLTRVVLARRMGQRRWDLELANSTRIKLAAGDLDASLARFDRLNTQTRIVGRAGQIVDLTLGDRIVISGDGEVSGTQSEPSRRAAAGLDPAQPL